LFAGGSASLSPNDKDKETEKVKQEEKEKQIADLLDVSSKYSTAMRYQPHT